MSEKAHASPTKHFFISMITKDIALEDCVFDLLDNSIDGARAYLKRQPAPAETAGGNGAKAAESKPDASEAKIVRPYEGFFVEIELDGKAFRIRDNCGGIPVDDAVNYAFHFGRRKGVGDADGTIGLYGIGMKRAMFKFGRKITVRSSTEAEGFEVPIDVNKWATEEPGNGKIGFEAWDFDLIRKPKSEIGTEITVTDLNKGIAEEFEDSAFVNSLVRTMARDYSIFLQRGLSIKVNKQSVTPYEYRLLESAEFQPIRFSYVDEGAKTRHSSGPPTPLVNTRSASVQVATSPLTRMGHRLRIHARVLTGRRGA